MGFLTIKASSHKKEEIVNITEAVAHEVGKAGVENGVCVLFVPHTTCGLIINENADPAVPRDMIIGINSFLPHDAISEFRHVEGNSPAHIKTSLVGQSQILLIENGNLVLGTWQGIFLAEFDGPKERKILIKILKEL